GMSRLLQFIPLLYTGLTVPTGLMAWKRRKDFTWTELKPRAVTVTRALLVLTCILCLLEWVVIWFGDTNSFLPHLLGILNLGMLFALGFSQAILGYCVRYRAAFVLGLAHVVTCVVQSFGFFYLRGCNCCSYRTCVFPGVFSYQACLICEKRPCF